MPEALTPHHLAPWDDDALGSLPDPATPAAMMNLAEAQVRLLREKFRNPAAGGRFVIAEITRRGMHIWRGVELKDKNDSR